MIKWPPNQALHPTAAGVIVARPRVKTGRY
jgi:hypothetical protein